MKTEPIWLTQFKHKLQHGQGYTATSQPILLRERYQLPNENLAESQNLYSYVIKKTSKFFKEDILKTAKENTITCESAIAEITARNKANHHFGTIYTGVVITDDLISKQDCNYHVVMLDAAKDYVGNYYPQIVKHSLSLAQAANDQELATNANLQLTWPSVQCLAFVNKNGDYFLALPVIKTNKDNIRLRIPVIDVTLSQVSRVLKHFPLTQIEKQNTTALKGPKWLRELNGGYLCQLGFLNYAPETVFYGKTRFDNYFMEESSRRHYIWQNNGTLAGTKIMLDGMDNSLAKRLESYHALFVSVLENNLQIAFKANGDLDLKFVPTKNKMWRKILTSKKILPKVRNDYGFAKKRDQKALDFRRTEQTDNLPDNRYRSYWWENEISKVYNTKLRNALAIPEITHKTTIETIDLTNHSGLKQLQKPKAGVQDLFLALQPGREHKYYATNKVLFTFYGKDKIDSYHGGYLDEHANN